MLFAVCQAASSISRARPWCNLGASALKALSKSVGGGGDEEEDEEEEDWEYERFWNVVVSRLEEECGLNLLSERDAEP